MSDGESQADEFIALQSIFNEEEFKYTSKEGLNSGLLFASVSIPRHFTIVIKENIGKFRSLLGVVDTDAEKSQLNVQYLPPIELAFTLPSNYPSQAPPSFKISCPWLSRDMLSKLCKELDRIWDEYKGSEVLFAWTHFLKEEALHFLGITETFEIYSDPLKNTKKKAIIQERNKIHCTETVQLEEKELQGLECKINNESVHDNINSSEQNVEANNVSTNSVNCVTQAVQEDDTTTNFAKSVTHGSQYNDTTTKLVNSVTHASQDNVVTTNSVNNVTHASQDNDATTNFVNDVTHASQDNDAATNFVNSVTQASQDNVVTTTSVNNVTQTSQHNASSTQDNGDNATIVNSVTQSSQETTINFVNSVTQAVQEDNASTSFVNTLDSEKLAVGSSDASINFITRVKSETKIEAADNSKTRRVDSVSKQACTNVKSSTNSGDNSEIQTLKIGNYNDSSNSKFNSKRASKNVSHSRKNSAKDLSGSTINVLLDNTSSCNQPRPKYRTEYFYSKTNPRYKKKRYPNDHVPGRSNENYNVQNDNTKDVVKNVIHVDEQKRSARYRGNSDKHCDRRNYNAGYSHENYDVQNVEIKSDKYLEEQKRYDTSRQNLENKPYEKSSPRADYRHENYKENDTTKNIVKNFNNHLQQKRNYYDNKRYEENEHRAARSSENQNVENDRIINNTVENVSCLEKPKRNYGYRGNFGNKRYEKLEPRTSHCIENQNVQNDFIINDIVQNINSLEKQKRNYRNRRYYENKYNKKEISNNTETVCEYRMNYNTKHKSPVEKYFFDHSFRNKHDSMEPNKSSFGEINEKNIENLNEAKPNCSKNIKSYNVEGKKSFKKSFKYENHKKNKVMSNNATNSSDLSIYKQQDSFKNDEEECINEKNETNNANTDVETVANSLSVSESNNRSNSIDCSGEFDRVGYAQDSYTHLYWFLKNYNKDRVMVDFMKSVHMCNICFAEKMGIECLKFQPCDHVFCQDCMREYFEVRIKESSVYNITCPAYKCLSEVMPSQIKEVVNAELFARYDSLLLSTTLDTMMDITYCPRPACRYPTSKEEGSHIAQCPSCDYVFCTLCNMVYHGIEPCRFKASEKTKICMEYQNASPSQQLFLEKKYGKKRLAALVETTLSETWIVSNSRKCPSCSASIEKSEGCNKMVCSKCGQFFCYLCGQTLSASTPYKHFNDSNSSCYLLLF